MRSLALALPALLLSACFGDHFGESLTLDAATGPASSSGATGGSTAGTSTGDATTGTATGDATTGTATSGPATTTTTTGPDSTTSPATSTTDPATTTTTTGTTDPAGTSSGTTGDPTPDPAVVDACEQLCITLAVKCGVNPLPCNTTCLAPPAGKPQACQDAYIPYVECLATVPCGQIAEALNGNPPADCKPEFDEYTVACS